MDREKLKQVAGYYFKDQMGMEPDTLDFTDEEDGIYYIRATAGKRVFKIWMLPMEDRICLLEIKGRGTFTDAAQLAGYDRNLKSLSTMKINITKRGTYTLSGITDAQYRAIRSVLQTADERCFDEKIDDI